MNRHSFRPLVVATLVNLVAAVVVFLVQTLGVARPWPGNAGALAWVTWALLAYVYVIDEGDQ